MSLPDYPEPATRTEPRADSDIIAQIREATSAPSPLTSYLKDPAVINAIDSPEAKGSRSRNQRHSSSSTRSREPRSSSILGLVLAEEEKQAHKLKSLLRSTGDRLDREIRRANQAVSRAERAESRVHELSARVSKAESSKYVVELEAARAREEIKRYKIQIESLERDVKRLQADVTLLEKQRNEADECAARARDTARKFQMELRNLQARHVGREEGLRYGMHKWFKTGRIEGFDTGHADGYESGRHEGYDEGREQGFSEGQEIGLKQGRKIGRQEGLDQGWEQGRREEREHVLQAFDDFFVAEIDERDQVVSGKRDEFGCDQADRGSLPPPRRRGKDIPRLPLSAFTPPNTGTSDTFPIPPTPSLITPSGIADSHLHITRDPQGTYNGDISHLKSTHKRAVVLSARGHSAHAIVTSLQSLQSGVVDAPVLAVLIPFVLNTTEIPEYLSATVSPALTTIYDGAIPVTSVKSLRWALEHGRVIDLDIENGIIAIDASIYDSLVNLLSKAIKSDTNTKRPPIVLTNALPPPLVSLTPVVTMMNHPTYVTYRQRISSLSLFENAYVKLLPPQWVSAALEKETQERELRNILKLFIVPVLEAFGFERIIFGSSPAFADGSPALAEKWYKLVLESFRELAVSQDEIDNIFVENAQRVYGSAQ
ncbi:hypothetical protein L210DRAFT_848389 [Boletus edulis BED1]|uniref:Uncharacterized protein n=1 Tax=Boletus edulis BED1 TaxID=1328754 RepID=A0AAD4GHM5_BOLED|nr:hypothetical protein L210DRAFT_848389 [Boletus edulis BED1]